MYRHPIRRKDATQFRLSHVMPGDGRAMMFAMGWYCARCGTRAETAGPCPRDGDDLREVDGVLGRAAGNYTLVEHIGGGGMGDVYRALNPAIDAEVAVKLLHAQSNTGKDATRFLVEARAVNRVKHDGVCKILDAGYLDLGQPYLVMDLLAGESLHALLKRGPLALSRALQIAEDVLAIVGAAHAVDIVHRDLKPQNVFLTTSGRTFILDFGVAKLLDGSTTISRTGAMVGTPAYMAPEQVTAGAIDARTDLYSCGVVLYEMLAGKRPFTGASAFAVAQSQLQNPPPPLPADLPEELQPIVETALAKTPQERYPDAETMRLAIAGVRAQLDAAPGRRNIRRWLVMAALFGIIVGGAVTAIAVASTDDDAPIRDAAVAVPDAAVSIDASVEAALVARSSQAIEKVLLEILDRRELRRADLPPAVVTAYERAIAGWDEEAIVRTANALLDSAAHLPIDAALVTAKSKALTAELAERRAELTAREIAGVEDHLAQASKRAASSDHAGANSQLQAAAVILDRRRH
jgi:hypothetical protein